MNIKEEYGSSINEVLNFLKNTNEELVKKIPIEFIEFLKSYSSNDDLKKVDKIKVSDLSEKSKKILGVIYINWWSTNEQKENFVKRMLKL